MHNRDFRIQKAQETLQIIEQGGYTINIAHGYKHLSATRFNFLKFFSVPNNQTNIFTYFIHTFSFFNHFLFF